MEGSASVGHPVDVATGAVYTQKEDFRVPGRFPILWLRSYRSGMPRRSHEPFGACWTSPFFAQLKRQGSEYHYITPDGTKETFADPDGNIDRGKAIRNPGTFKELTRNGLQYKVTHWSPETRNVTHYVFILDRNGEWWPLRAIEDNVGGALELAWSESGLLKGVRQKLEKRTLLFTHGAQGRISEIAFRMPNGAPKTLAKYAYDGDGRLARTIDMLGRTERFEYDNLGRMTREWLKDGGVFSFKYDDSGRCIRTSGLDNYNFKAIRYFESMGLTEVTNSYGTVQRFKWNPAGQVELFIDETGAQTKTEFDEHGRIVAKIDPMGAAVRFGFDGAGNRNKITNQVGIVTEFEFNESRVPVKMVDGGNNVWIRKYDDANRLKESLDPLGNSWRYEYDSRGLLAKIEAPGGKAKHFEWDESGNLVSATDWEGHRFRRKYDVFGRIVSVTTPSGQETRNTIDDAGQLVRVDFHDATYFSYAYDAGGNLVRERMRDGTEKTWRFGPCNRVLEEREPNGAVRRFQWGSEPNRLEKVFNGKGEAYTFIRDATGRTIEEIGFDGRKIGYKYNLSGFPVLEISASGKRTTIQRDGLGRILKQTFSDGTQADFAYDPMGRIAEANNDTVKVRFERDAAGRLIREIQGNVTIESRYDGRGNRIGLAIDGAESLEYAYDGNGDTESIALSGFGSLSFGHDSLGSEVSRRFPDGRTLIQTRDEEGRLASQAVDGFSRKYAYDLKGNIAAIEDEEGNKTRFEYDPSSYLLKVRDERERLEGYRYDEDGNLLQITTDSVTRRMSLEKGDRVIQAGGISYAYDSDGQVISKRQILENGTSRDWAFEWNDAHQLKRVVTPEGEEWTYAYDALGRRTSKRGATGEEKTVWDGDVVLAQALGGSRTLWQFGRRDFSPLFRFASGKLQSVVCDHLGTPRTIVEDGKPGLGEIRIGTWGDSDSDFPIRFKGQWHDRESGLLYNRYRYYDPHSCRYLSQDPIGLGGGTNLYRYARNPTSHTDPFGLCDKTELDWSRTNPKGQTAEEHVQLHEQNNLRKAEHGVFYGDSVDTVNQAWANKGDIKPIQIPGGNGNDVYVIPSPNSGYAGGYTGQGQNLDHVTIVTLQGTNTVVTGYPSGNGVSQGPYYSSNP